MQLVGCTLVAVYILLQTVFPAMPPKLDVQVKLQQIRSYVNSNVRQLASRNKTSLKAVFAVGQHLSTEEKGFYMHLHRHEHSFTDDQRSHADQTLALLTQHSASSRDLHPVAQFSQPSRGSSHPAANLVRKAADDSGSGGSGVEQPSVGDKAMAQSVRDSESKAAVACEQCPVKKARVPTGHSSICVPHVAANNGGKPKTLLLQLKRPHYNAIKDQRKLWEARPLEKGCGSQTLFDKLAVVGNCAVLQSGAGTNDRVRIAEVRRYVSQRLSCPLQDMIADLGADLLPDVADDEERAKVYESLYGSQCLGGFVAMRLEWPSEAAAATEKQQLHFAHIEKQTPAKTPEPRPEMTPATKPILEANLFAEMCNLIDVCRSEHLKDEGARLAIKTSAWQVVATLKTSGHNFQWESPKKQRAFALAALLAGVALCPVLADVDPLTFASSCETDAEILADARKTQVSIVNFAFRSSGMAADTFASSPLS